MSVVSEWRDECYLDSSLVVLERLSKSIETEPNL